MAKLVRWLHEQLTWESVELSKEHPDVFQTLLNNLKRTY